ncbi:MAG: hypothetical protein IPK50_10995 [Fibrobacterota bacterium]|nr:MAG: hypothetical protein IPK50_10995 [Fibrobacterota bacterium]
MASPLRNPWVASALAFAAIGFLGWRLAPMFRGAPTSEPVAVAATVPESSSSGIAAPLPETVSDTATLPLTAAQSRDSLGGWEVPDARDPFVKSRDPSGGRPKHRPPAATGPLLGHSTQKLSVRGLATGSANLVLAQGRVLAEGDTFAGGVLRAIRSDRILIRRPTGDTVFFFPRGTLP